MATGCWDRRELEDRELVTAMAIDKGKKGLNVSVQVPIPANIVGSGSSGGGSGKSVQVFSEESLTLADALTKLREKMDKNLFLGYLGLLLLGEEQSKTGIINLLDMMRRDPFIQRRVFPVVTKGRSQQLLTNGTEMEQIKTMFIENMIEAGKETESLMPSTLNDVLISLSTPTRQVPVLNYVGLAQGQYKWLGLAVFRKDRMIGTLTPNESIPLLHIREQKRGQLLLTSCPKGEGYVQFFPLNLRRTIRVNSKPSLHIQIELEGRVLEKTCKYIGDKIKQTEKIEKQVEKTYEQMAKRLITKSQNEWNLDIFQLGHYVNAYHHAIYKKSNWTQMFSQIPIDVSYHVYIRREGTSVK